ncbi:MAG: poly(U)-specific 3'-to-5' RNA exonuclease [Alyxoria varia]|nr:MAG: poly(U)-specific 3'-to-5' RNA exonuclease [Alyxoria varia]
MPLVNYSGLVDYSSSSDSDREPEHREAKRIRSNKTSAETPREQSLPPLPTNFRDLYASGTRVSTQDDPSLHGGRKRTMPHMEGNWPTHVYLEWYPSQTERSTLEHLIDAVESSTNGSFNGETAPKAQRKKLRSSLMSDLNTPSPLHISLSCPLQLATERREDYLEALKSSLSQAWEPSSAPAAPGSKAAAFPVQFKGLHWVANAERTRWFLALQIARPDRDELNKLLTACNRVAKAKGLPMLYAKELPQEKSRKIEKRGRSSKCGGSQNTRKASLGSVASGSVHEDFTSHFHFSIAWTVEEPEEEGTDLIRSDDNKAMAFKEASKIRVEFDDAKIKIGNQVTSIPLSANLGEGQGILG